MPTPRAHLELPKPIALRLDSLKEEFHLGGRPAVISKLVDAYKEQSAGLPIATFENIMSEPAPICITGLPGSGKSYALHDFLKTCDGKGFNIFFVDTVNETKLGSNVSVLKALAFNPRPGFFRFVPEEDPRTRRFTMRRLFERLGMLEIKGQLRNFVVAIDEGNQFADLPQVRDFVIESRKFTRKVVVISADSTQYEGLCKMMRPLPKL